MTPADLRTWRMSRGFSQWEVADLLGINSRTYQDLEYGRNSAGQPRDTIPLYYERALRDIDRELNDKPASG